MKVFMDDVRLPDSLYFSEDCREWVTVRKISYVKELLSAGLVTDLSLDHDMGDANEETGYDLVKWICEEGYWPSGTIYVHSANPVGAKNMRETIERYRPKGPCKYNVRVYVPLGNGSGDEENCIVEGTKRDCEEVVWDLLSSFGVETGWDKIE